MKNLYFALLKKRGPWTIGNFGKTRFRDIFKNPGSDPGGPSPLPEAIARDRSPKIELFHGHPKNPGVPPLPPGGRGGTPIPGLRPGIKSTPKIAFHRFFFCE